jgi:hypothetical protein
VFSTTEELYIYIYIYIYPDGLVVNVTALRPVILVDGALGFHQSLQVRVRNGAQFRSWQLPSHFNFIIRYNPIISHHIIRTIEGITKLKILSGTIMNSKFRTCCLSLQLGVIRGCCVLFNYSVV